MNRKQIARLGGLTRALQGDTHLAPRAGFMAKFEREVDPDGVLDQDERERRAKIALELHMTRLAYKSSEARAKTVRRREAAMRVASASRLRRRAAPLEGTRE
jgi:hypothetical protein